MPEPKKSAVSRALDTIRAVGQKAMAPINPALLRLSHGMHHAEQRVGQAVDNSTVAKALVAVRDSDLSQRADVALGFKPDPELVAMKEREEALQRQIEAVRRVQEEKRLHELANQGVRQKTDYEF